MLRKIGLRELQEVQENGLVIEEQQDGVSTNVQKNGLDENIYKPLRGPSSEGESSVEVE
jgi:hypothetical protein